VSAIVGQSVVVESDPYEGVPEDVRERIEEYVALHIEGAARFGFDPTPDLVRSWRLSEWREWLADGERMRQMYDDWPDMGADIERHRESFIERSLLETKPSWLLTDEDRVLLRQRFLEPGPYEVVVVGAKPDARLSSWLDDYLGLDDMSPVVGHEDQSVAKVIRVDPPHRPVPGSSVLRRPAKRGKIHRVFAD
jgi:hypothetical protein